MMEEPFGRLRRFLRELKRRNVYKVAVTYAVVAFVVVQAADVLFPRLLLPAWSVRLVIGLALLGFPIALVLAWAFEMTPEGVRRTPEAEPEVEAAERSASGTGGWIVALLFLLLAVSGGWYLMGGGGESPEVSEQTVAVLPFQVSGSGTEEWREGMVTMLGTGLDGAAGLRTIADQTVLAAWERADTQTGGAGDPRFLTAARRVGAQYAVIGSAVKLGGELRLSADIHETPSGERLGQVEVQGFPDSVTALTDDLTRRVLGVLLEESGEDLPSVNLASLTTFSLPALKSYLRGERHLRAGNYRAAIEDYEAAVEEDSAFALAYTRLSLAVAWGGKGSRREIERPLDRAYELSGNLPLRERRRVRARHAWVVQNRPAVAVDSFQRWTEVYPDDPSIWYEYGEAHFHGYVPGGWPVAEKAFERAIELDPGVAAYHHHLVDLAMSFHHDSALADRRIAAHPSGPVRRIYRAFWALTFGSAPERETARARLDTLTLPGRPWWIRDPLTHPTDRALQAGMLRTLGDRAEAHRAVYSAYLAANLLERGHIEEALRPLRQFDSAGQGGDAGCLLAEASSLNYPLPDSVVRQNLDPDRLGAEASVTRLRCAGLYLVNQGRVDELPALLSRIQETASSGGIEEVQAPAAVEELRGYRAWKAGGLERAARLWSSSKPAFTSVPAIWRGDLYRELDQRERAESWYLAAWRHPVAHQRLGRLYQEMGRPEKAAAAFRRFIAAWENSDEELQERVEEARRQLQALTSSERAADE